MNENKKSITEEILNNLNNTDPEDLIKKISSNPILSEFFGKKGISDHIKSCESKLSKQALNLYLHLIDDNIQELVSSEIFSKSNKENYDYVSMLSRFVDTLTKFDNKYQEYILLKSVEAAAMSIGDRMFDTLNELINNKRYVITAVLDVFRMIEPYFIRCCQEVNTGIVTSEQVESYLKENSIKIGLALSLAEEVINESKPSQ